MSGEGELVAGRYRLSDRVGRGGMGVVWRAHDERLDRVVAVKELRTDHGDDDTAHEAALERAMREGRVAARLRHPHAVTVHDVVTHGHTPFLVMEFLPSRSLSALVADRGPLPAEEVAVLGAQVASALAAAHAEGIVHRDVKPGNVLVTDDGTTKIADFGISRADGEGTITDRGVIAGTPAYLSPEAADSGRVGPPSDVFSLGATLYFAIEGVPPFGDTGNTIALLVRIAHAQPAPPRNAGPLAELLLAMLRRDPDERPTMRQVRELLTAVAEGRSASVPRAHPRTRLLPVGAARRLPRRAAVTGLVAGALVAVGMALGAALNTDRSLGEAAAQPAASKCEAELRVTNRWPGGYQGEVVVKPGSGGVVGWEVRWSLPEGHRVSDVWNGTPTRLGDDLRVRDAGWNAAVRQGSATAFGFVASTSPEADSVDEVGGSLACVPG
ncbi:serine/threonine-protein kinase [Saccharomonospora cyanea]|uniref:non-specific serine/threonine protein kinase n=1 Tax=Saccharomonospora cyanea NA-134 TaxID=882082 RepID=H5XGV3_9PSEU|nr:serine/threonine-protein kinase [Saccharomonospora cyanea]EHR62680.1 protein kinase family protein with cellulose-binding domain [Saccharomonospora cyanea NA-134]